MGKKYGQHFLNNETVLADIASAVFELQDKYGYHKLIEIGPGQGVLTKLLVDNFDQATLYEIDTKMKHFLSPIESRHTNIEIVRGDVLESELEIDEDTLIIGNLPYYITSPILRKFFEPSPHISSAGLFLVQHEVAEKLKSDAKKKSYLRWILNNFYEIEYLFKVDPQNFDPPPKVDSAVIRIKRRETSIKKGEKKYTSMLSQEEFDKMLVFLDVISGLKRKTMSKTAKLRGEKLSEAGITIPDDLLPRRLEELSREDMKKIVKN